MDFLKWYKNKIESNNQEPPENIWGNIQDELDIEESWLFIKTHLNKKSYINRQYLFAAAATILFFILAGGYWFFEPQLKQYKIEQLSENNKGNKETKTNGNNAKIENVKEITTKKNKATEKRVASYKTENKNLLVTESQAQNAPEVTRDNETLLALLGENPGIVGYHQSKPNDLKKSNNIQPIADGKSEKNSFKKMYMGTTGQLANTWLLNEKTVNGLESSDLTSANASFGYNFGLFIGTNISKRIDIQFDLNLLARNNQDYNEYINGHYVSNQMKFNYSQAALSLRYYILSKRFMKGEHGINLGGYLGYLHNAYQVIDGKSFSIQNYYTDFDYGLFIAYEYVIPVSNKIGFGTGFRAYYGLQNIFSGDEYIPAYMNKTSNASLNITLSLKYNLK